MKLHSILREATTPWVGPLEDELGNGRPYTLNYGTGSPGRPNILYIPVPLSVVRSAIKLLSGPITVDGIRSPGKSLTHVGEAHATVSMGPELPRALGQQPGDTLRGAGLFDDDGNGITVQVVHTHQYKVMNAAFYKDEADPAGPQLVAELVDIPQLSQIRTALGLSPLPQIPGIAQYLPHITVGYMANLNNIHKSYVDQKGSSPRSRQSLVRNR